MISRISSPGEGSQPRDDQLASDIYNLLNNRNVVADAPSVAGEEDERGDGDAVEAVDDEEEGDGVIEVDVHEVSREWQSLEHSKQKQRLYHTYSRTDTEIPIGNHVFVQR